MAARFAQGTSVSTTNRLNQLRPVGTSRGAGASKTGGMPGYIKTSQDKSAGGLDGKEVRGGKIPQSSGPRAIPSRKGENRRDWQSHTSVNGSADRSYRATSTGKPGVIRPTKMPMKPAGRSTSEKEGPSRGEAGSKTAVSNGGVLGANKLPAGGAKMGRASGHATMSGGKGSAPARGGGQKVGMNGRTRTGMGTMEKLAGKGKYSQSGITSRRKSMMY